jgi:putative transcriptional regulator
VRKCYFPAGESCYNKEKYEYRQVNPIVEVLRNKNLATKFQILAEIANSGPNVPQRDIARRLEVTPQAISDYIGQMIEDGLIVLDSHSKYKVTNEGINWIIKVLRDMKDYGDFVAQAINNISVCTAIADSQLEKGQKVSLLMKNGVLVASAREQSGATGETVSEARSGEDVGIKDIEGIVSLKFGQVTIVKIPNVQHGGSRSIDLEQLKKTLDGKPMVGAIGIEALVALKKIQVQDIYFFGVKEAAVEAVHHGISPLIVCVENDLSGLLKKLEEASITYQLTELSGS